MTVRLPDSTKRTAVIGSTGSGKTRGGIWLLSSRDWDVRPWVIIDFKHDDFIARIPGLQEIRVTDAPPKRPGLYVVRPHPDDQAELDQFMYRCWDQENIGLFFDEGLMVGKNGRSRWMRALLTQGRSKHIPMITQLAGFRMSRIFKGNVAASIYSDPVFPRRASRREIWTMAKTTRRNVSPIRMTVAQFVGLQVRTTSVSIRQPLPF